MQLSDLLAEVEAVFATNEKAKQDQIKKVSALLAVAIEANILPGERCLRATRQKRGWERRHLDH